MVSFLCPAILGGVMGPNSLDLISNDYTTFLSLLLARCTTYFPLDKYRIAISKELRACSWFVRTLFFRQERTEDLTLKVEVKYLRKILQNELKSFTAAQLHRNLAMCHTASSTSVAFRSKTKRFFKSTSSSWKGFIWDDSQALKEVQQMTEIAGTHNEELFAEPKEITRRHSYVDIPFPGSEIIDEPIPPADIFEKYH
jgi:hypothetical protein